MASELQISGLLRLNQFNQAKSSKKDMARHEYNSGIIGNCGFIAHINAATAVCWLCWPRFDSSFIFGSLLDKEKGGEFSILPRDAYTSEQHYIENTNILCTRVQSGEDAYLITDFAPRFKQNDRYYRPLMLIRKIEPLSGNPLIKVTCKPVGEYGEQQLRMIAGSNHLQYDGLESPLRLTTNISVNAIKDESYFVLNEIKYLVLTYGAPLEASLEQTAESFLSRTILYWRGWVKNTTISNFYQGAVIRSSLALKIHQYEDTGAIIAASTTSLPEFDKSGRTWDYRYCWLRDTYYILQAFNNIGHFEEMEKYFSFISNISRVATDRFQPLYSITGLSTLTEKELPLKGYLGNQPVRIGNQAYEHIQNDVYGQVLIALLPLFTDQRFVDEERTGSISWLSMMLDKMEATIHETDAGLWEYRHASSHHCYTKLFYWTGASAAIKIAVALKEKKLVSRAVSLKRIATHYIEQCYDPVQQAYTDSIGSEYMDASTLQLILMNYLNPHSLKARKHLKAVESKLQAANGLFYRYLHADDFGLPQTTFLICAFWHVEALACVGRLEEATTQFEGLMQISNKLGLLSEDVSPVDGSQWGNFPQAYSHVGLMNAAYRISRKLDRPIFL